MDEPEANETWKAIDEETMENFKRSRYSQWDFGAGELVKNSAEIIKVCPNIACLRRGPSYLMSVMQLGLYDRPELSTWHKGRVILIGDAAHPTSPVCLLEMLLKYLLTYTIAPGPGGKPSA